MKLLIGADKQVAAWVASQMPIEVGFDGDYKAVGIIANDGTPLGGAVFDDFRPNTRTMQGHLAFFKPLFLSKRLIREILSYPFEVANVQRLWCAMAHDNHKIIELCCGDKERPGLGFKKEAVLARHFGEKHAVIARMFKKDFHRIYG